MAFHTSILRREMLSFAIVWRDNLSVSSHPDCRAAQSYAALSPEQSKTVQKSPSQS